MPLQSGVSRLCHRTKNLRIHLKIRVPQMFLIRVLAFDPNLDGIRGLTRNVSEWGVRLALSPNGQPQFVVLGGVRGTVVQGSTPFPGIAQGPSMAFEDVGFRCARVINEKQQ